MSHNYRLLPCSCLVLGMLAGFAAGAAPALAMDDDLALDMGLDFEEYSAPSADINGSASRYLLHPAFHFFRNIGYFIQFFPFHLKTKYGFYR